MHCQSDVSLVAEWYGRSDSERGIEITLVASQKRCCLGIEGRFEGACSS
jgi:hypothetical protein